MATALAARCWRRGCAGSRRGFVAGLLHDIGKLVLAAHFPAGAQALALARSADVGRRPSGPRWA
jgi:HD-like signal output (HDOD) protein